jgi:hypothetical protein
MDWLQRRPLVAILVGLAAVLFMAIGIETGFGTQLRHALPPPPAKPAAPPDAKLLPPLAQLSPEQAYPETTARPLFVPTRRAAPVETASKATFEKGQYTLQGVIVVGDQRTALLREKTTGRVHRVDKGKDVNGIVVETIEPTKVTLALGGERETLNLTVQKAASGAPGAAGAPSQPTAAAADHGPFASAGAGHPQGAASPANAAANPPQASAVGAGSAPVTNPATAQRAVTPGATNQPMTPEELLARRRARRNQPTQ